jgi:hypothetical protein
MLNLLIMGRYILLQKHPFKIVCGYVPDPPIDLLPLVLQRN